MASPPTNSLGLNHLMPVLNAKVAILESLSMDVNGQCLSYFGMFLSALTDFPQSRRQTEVPSIVRVPGHDANNLGALHQMKLLKQLLAESHRGWLDRSS
jgi:hypothetical protein